MIIRVPLVLQRSIAVINRLDISATRLDDPPGEESEGYDPTFRTPIVYERVAGVRESSRRELAATRIPCQVEIASDERLRELGVGDDPITNMILVFHRKDLESQGLLDASRDVILKKGDRISKLERFGAPVGTVMKTFKDPGLFVFEMRSASFGFGPDGYDLELAITTNRQLGRTT